MLIYRSLACMNSILWMVLSLKTGVVMTLQGIAHRDFVLEMSFFWLRAVLTWDFFKYRELLGSESALPLL